MTTPRWTKRAAIALLGATTAVAGSPAAQAEPLDNTEHRNVGIVQDAFSRGVGAPDTFYAILADDVHWTVARANAPATYTSRQQFLDSGAKPVVDRLTGQIQAQVHELIAADDEVVARWRGTATALDGQPYVNEYNWVMTLDNDRVTHVVAYLDLVELDHLLTRVPLPA
jgi:ketosteroid isomerase-like protein